MTTPTNYGELKTSVADYCKRANLTARIPEFIRGTEDRIKVALRDVSLITHSTLAVSSEWTSLPTDFQKLIAFGGIDNKDTIALPVNRMQDVASGADNLYYCIVGREIQVLPVQSSTTFDIVYEYGPGNMSSDTDSPQLLQDHPFLYVWGAVMAYRLWSNQPADKVAEAAEYFGQYLNDVKEAAMEAQLPAHKVIQAG